MHARIARQTVSSNPPSLPPHRPPSPLPPPPYASRLLELVLAADVVPAHARHLKLELAQCARPHLRQRRQHVLPPHLRRRRASFRLRRAARRRHRACAGCGAVGYGARECGKRGMAVERGEVSAHEAGCAACCLVEVGGGEGMRRAREERAQNLAPRRLARHAHLDLAVKPARAAQRRVERLRPVGGGEHEERLPSRVHAVHVREQCRQQARLARAVGRVARGADGVDLVEEDERGCAAARLGEERVELGLRLPLSTEQLRRPHESAMHLELTRQCTRDHRLAGARGAEEQQPGGRRHPHRGEEAGLGEGQLHRLAYRRQHAAHTRHVTQGGAVLLGCFAARAERHQPHARRAVGAQRRGRRRRCG